MRLDAAIPKEPSGSFVTISDISESDRPFVKPSENLSSTVRISVNRQKHNLAVVETARVTLTKNDVLKVILESRPSSEAFVRGCHQLFEEWNE